MFSEEVLQSFFTSVSGQITVGVVTLVILLAFIAILHKRQALTVQALTYSAVAITLSIVLSQFRLFRLPQGGSVTPFSMLFIILIGYWFGPLPGILAGVSHGLISLMIDPYVVHPLQLLLDYPLAFGALGLSGLFQKDQQNGLFFGLFAGTFGRFCMSFLSGYIFFASYTPEGFHPVVYSIAYNISYIGVETFLTALLLMVPGVRHAIQHIKSNISAKEQTTMKVQS
ncbi:MAG: energy-coupled thiamine transporter ThiT [Epulopiscium sp.]|nr:energy-coupled thiamine transporter ThiT [Candidatus Epulonipiscium sp.]